MDKPIGVGDLVMVVRPTPCCGCTDSIGDIFRVKWMGHLEGECCNCGDDSVASEGPGADSDANNDEGYLLSRLKRIPPLSELETVRTEDEVTA